MKTEKTPLVRLIDDDQSVLTAQATFLQMADINVCCYSGAQAFLGNDDFDTPGCLVLDVRMPGMSGIELQAEMKARKIDLPIIFLSAHGDIDMAVAAVQNGAKNFLVKPPQLDRLLTLIQEAINDDIEHRKLKVWLAELEISWSQLNKQQQQIAEMVAKGLPNSVIAEAIGLSEKTVRNYRANIYELLDVVNAAELASFLHDRDNLKTQLKL